MVRIGILSHRGFSPSAIVNRTSRVAICADFAQTKAHCSPYTLFRSHGSLRSSFHGPSGKK